MLIFTIKNIFKAVKSKFKLKFSQWQKIIGPKPWTATRSLQIPNMMGIIIDNSIVQWLVLTIHIRTIQLKS